MSLMTYSLRAFSSAVIGCAFLVLASIAQAEETKGSGTKEDQKNLIAGLCTTQLDLDAAGCTCVAERSLTELNDDQRAYLVLSVVQPQAAEKMPIAKSQEELTAIFNFLGAAHESCKSGAASPAQDGATPQ
jgi:hypothetical protein